MRLIFMGYHNVGYCCLEAFIDLCREYRDDLAAVVTLADDPGENIWFASVRDLAFAHYLPVYQPRDPNDPEFVAAMAKLQPDFLFSCYYRHMLQQPLLKLPRRGALNLHGSLLPRYRGRCSTNWVLINCETETGVTLHYMELKPDKGDMVAHKPLPIAPEDTAATLLSRQAAAAGELMREIYTLLRTGHAPRIKQDQAQASYFGGRRPEDGLIDWRKSAGEIYNLMRAVTHPYPGAFTYYRGKKLFIWWGQPFTAAAAEAHEPPGQVLTGLPGQGLLVATGGGQFLIQKAQFEGEPEFFGPILATWRHLMGERLGT